MLGNLSQTIVKVPYYFHLLSKLSSHEFSKTRYREPPLLDTFSQLKKINSGLNKRYFRLNDHFKENAPYKDLNYNNNKRFIAPVFKLPKRTFQSFLYSDYDDYERNIKKNKSQVQINNNSLNCSGEILINTNKDINIMNNRYNNNLNAEEKKIILESKKDENINECNKNEEKNYDPKNINDNNNKKEGEENEEKEIKKYLDKLKDKKPKNLKELKEFLDIRYMEEKKENKLPKIRCYNRSISQVDLYKKAIDKKIESLTMVKPEIKNSIYKRKKNMVLKRDYNLIQKIYVNHKNYPFRLKHRIENNDILC